MPRDENYHVYLLRVKQARLQALMLQFKRAGGHMDCCASVVLPLVLLAHAARGADHQLSRYHDAGLRHLMQTAPALPAGDTPGFQITVVDTAAQFSAAVTSGAAHIEVRGHLDLSSLEPAGDTALGTLPSSVKSIRVCSCVHSLGCTCTVTCALHWFARCAQVFLHNSGCLELWR